VAEPALSVTQLLFVAQVNPMPVMSLLYSSIPTAVKLCWLPICMDADAGDTLIFVNTEGSGATARLIVVICGVKPPEVPVMTTVVVPVVAVVLAVRVKMLVVALVEVNDAVTPLGRPEATKLTLLVKPPVGFTVIVLGTLLP
jgi:hypothetical protein